MWISFYRKNDDNNLLFDIGCVLLARIMYNKSYKVKFNWKILDVYNIVLLPTSICTSAVIYYKWCS